MRNRLILLAVVAIVAVAIAWRFQSRDGKSPEAGGAPIVEVSLPGLSGAAAEGEVVFNAKCASCHGTNAAGRQGMGPPLVHIIYEPNHHGDAAFHLAARNGVRAHHWQFGDMPPVEGVAEGDIERIVTYVRTLQRANGIE